MTLMVFVKRGYFGEWVEAKSVNLGSVKKPNEDILEFLYYGGNYNG